LGVALVEAGYAAPESDGPERALAPPPETAIAAPQRRRPSLKKQTPYRSSSSGSSAQLLSEGRIGEIVHLLQPECELAKQRMPPGSPRDDSGRARAM
jgi:hypothetical protein